MPNDCYNSLTIEANPETIKKILSFVKSDESAFDFNKIIPMPDYIYDGNVGTKEKEIYGKYNWYDWSRENWGTKWNAYDIETAAEELMVCLDKAGISTIDWNTNGSNVFIFTLNPENAFDLDFDDINVYGERLTEAIENVCYICGEPIDGSGTITDKGICCDGCKLHFEIGG